MRRVMAGDLFALAAYLAELPPARRANACQRLFSEAECADKYRKRYLRRHRCWGDGSLLARIGCEARRPVVFPDLQSPNYCHCLQIALAEMTKWRAAKQDHAGNRATNSVKNAKSHKNFTPSLASERRFALHSEA
ncbi:hypothetical protein SAMN04488044_0659 [Cognatishimia maritima]|uniref:DUF7742 domain-containing protein n=1 Tax=Cognatishimia maritima TaxID=870908 RepID=A0A1M5JH11_9RHOB|nr:hypothetical protein SAMN04488044_0659 [Cognatishimia maritima]